MSFIYPFHFSFWKISFGLILNCEHSHNKSKSLPKKIPPIQTSIKMQSVVSKAFDNFNFIKTKQKPPPLQPTNHLHENSKLNFRQNKMEGEFISLLLRREVVRLGDLTYSRKSIGSELKSVFPRLSLVYFLVYSSTFLCPTT